MDEDTDLKSAGCGDTAQGFEPPTLRAVIAVMKGRLYEQKP